jgi:pyruvate/2-oxoglutarate dehydrogenase complex dihydrolipoamide dehydrogenase (E3) component
VRVVVIGAGPAGVMAALRAAELGADTALVTRGEFGGMAANDGPVPVRTLAHAARLIRGSRQLGRYGIETGEPRLDYGKLLARVREVAGDVRDHSGLRAQAAQLGVKVHEQVGPVRFVASHAVQAERGTRFEADRFIVCTGGVSRRLIVPGAELVATHSDAWGLTSVPESMLVIGGGMTGLQVASIFHAFGCRMTVFQRGPRILPDEDEDVAVEVARQLRASGMVIHEGFGTIERFERAGAGTRMTFARDGRRETAEAALALAAIGWVADTAGLCLDAAGVALDERGFVKVDAHLATSVPHIFAAGDVTGRSVLVPPAVLDAHAAATNAVHGPGVRPSEEPIPMGGFTEPEYAHVGFTESEARRRHEIVVGRVEFAELVRHVIDGREDGFCKLIAERATGRVLGCHVVGERAVEIVQAFAIAMAGGVTVADLARRSLAFPTYLGAVTRAAYRAGVQVQPALAAEGPGGLIAEEI